MMVALEAFSRSPRRSVAIGMAVLLLLALAWFGISRPVRRDDPQAAVADPAPSAGFQPTTAQWDALKIEPIGKLRFDSVLVADGVVATNDNATAAVFSPFSGRVTTILAQLGQTVRRGDPLARLLATEAVQSDSDLAAAGAAQSTANKQLELAQLTEQRQHGLLLAEAGTQKDWLQSQTDLVAAENSQRAARAVLAAARARAVILGDFEPLPDGTKGYGMITAPIAGVVVQRQVSPGQVVNSLSAGGSAALFTIADLRTVWVLASVNETDAAALKVGQPVEVSALALPARALHAQIAWISAVVDPATHRVGVRAELPNPDLALKPQMSVTVRLFEGHPSEVIAIPRSAIVYEGSDAHCYVATRDRTLVARKLQIGRIQGNQAEVVSGLSAGDRVVTRGALFIDRAMDDSTS